MAIGLAFVDIIGDTSRTGDQVERDMNRVLAVVEDEINPVEVQAAVDNGTERDLTQELNRDLRAVAAAINAVQVRADLDPDTRDRLQRQLRDTSRALRSARTELQVRVDNRPIVEDVTAAVVEAVEVAEAVAPPVEIEVDIDTDRLQRGLASIGRGALSAIPSVKSLGIALGALASPQAIAGVVGALEAIAPAAAVAAPAVASIGLAMGTLQLATMGVSDAISKGLDPSDPEKYAKALEALGPEARKFVETIVPGLEKLQKQVQGKVFAGLDESLRQLSSSALPPVKTAVLDTGTALNAMAALAADAAGNLGKSGVLGKALDSATAGLQNLVEVPAQAVTAFGQLAAAAGPAFEKLTLAIAGRVDKISANLTKAFESGELTKAIDLAVDVIKELGHVLANVGRIFTSVFGAANQSGGLLIQTLGNITDSLVKTFNSPAVQSGLQALFSTMSTLATVGAPLLGMALGVVAQALTALAPGAKVLIEALGAGLRPIIEALGPVLLSAAQAVTQLLMAFSPLLPVIGLLISQVGPILTPILDAIALAFQRLAPVIAQVATMLGQFLGPILAQIPVLIQPFIDAFLQLTSTLFPLALQLLVQLQPALMTLSSAFVQLIGAVGPLIGQIVQLAVTALQPLLPLLPPIIGFVAQLAGLFANELARNITAIVVPAIKSITLLLQGDFKGAFKQAMEATKGFAEQLARMFFELPANILMAIGNLGNTLVGIGADLIGGLIRGIKNKLGELKNLLGDVTSMIPDWKGPMSRDRVLLRPTGQVIMDGLIDGLGDRTPDLQAALGGVTAMIGSQNMTIPGVTMGSGSLGGATVAAASMPGGTAMTGAATGVPVVQVFLGTREIEDIVGVQVQRQNAVEARRIVTGSRR